MRSIRERERERDLFYASTARVWAYGGCLRGNMSLRLQGVYEGNTIPSLLTPVCGPPPLRQMYPGPYNAGGTALLQVPTLQKSLLLQGFLAPPQVPVAFVALCTIGAACALSLWTAKRVKLCPFLPAHAMRSIRDFHPACWYSSL